MIKAYEYFLDTDVSVSVKSRIQELDLHLKKIEEWSIDEESPSIVQKFQQLIHQKSLATKSSEHNNIHINFHNIT